MTLLRPLRRQILIALIAIGIIPLAIAGAILIMLDRQALSTQSARELTGLARGFSAEVDLYMSSRMNDTRAIASLPAMASNDLKQQQATLSQMYLIYSDFSQLALYTLDGVQIAKVQAASLPIVERFTAFQDAAERGQQAWEITSGESTGTRAVVIFTPVRDSERKVIAVLGAVVNWPTLTSVIDRLSIGTGGRAFILNSDAQTVFHPDPGLLANLDSKTWPELATGLPPPGPGTFRYPASDDTYVVAYAPISSLGWTAIVERPERELLAPVKQTSTIGVIGLAISILLALIAALGATNWLARPLQQLAAATKAFGAVNSDASLPLPGSSTKEINELVESFADMRSAVTEALRRERSERALSAAILSSVPIGLGVLSSDLRLTSANQALVDLLGTDNGNPADDGADLVTNGTSRATNGDNRAAIIGKPLSAIWRNQDLQEGAKLALTGTVPVHHLALERDNPRQLLRVFFDRIKADDEENDERLLIGIEDLSEFSQVKLRYQSMEMLQAISDIILSSNELQETLQHTLEIIMTFRKFDIGIVWLNQVESQQLSPIALHGINEMAILDAESEESRQFVSIKKLQQINDPAEIVRTRPHLSEQKLQSLITIPLRTNLLIFGVIELGSVARLELSNAESELLDTIGSQMGHAVQKFSLDDALRKSEAEARPLALVASRTSNAVIIANRRGEIEWVNEGFTRITGYEAHEVIGRKPGALLQGPASDPAVIEHMRAKIRAGEGFRSEIINYRKDGGTYWIDIEVQPILDSSGNLLRFMALESDVTERKQTQQELQFQKALLEAQSEAAVDGILVVSADRKWLSQNRRFREIWELDGVTPQPNDSETALAMMVHKVVDPKQFIARVHYLYEHPNEQSWDEVKLTDGRVLERYAAPLSNEAGSYIGRVWFYRDITERQRFLEEIQEQREFAQQIMTNMGQGLTVTDDLCNFKYVNPAFGRLLKQNTEELIGKTQFDVTSAKDWQTLQRAQASLKAGHTTSYEVDLLVEGYPPLPVRITSAPRLSDGKQVGVISVVTDIAEQKQAEEYLRSAKEIAEQANRAKSDFLSRMSHELRTPLNAILGFAQVLQMDTLSANQQNSTAQILSAGQHLLDLINEVLDIARIEAGRLSISPEPVRVWSVMQEGMELVRPLAVGREIQLKLLLEEDNIYVKVDRQRIKQVLVNLLSNAVKYNRYGGTVSINWQQVSPKRVRIDIIDTGYGISKAKQERLFVPFDRLDSEGGEIEGTGLGLALSKRLVEVMGGVIGIDSVLEKGSTFWVDLPLAESPLTTRKPMQTLEAPTATAIKTSSVLCIEDNPSNLQLIENIFQRQPNIKLLTALQGRLGITLAREHHPDVVLLDLHLPDIHGSEVVDELQNDESTRDIPVIILSADATPSQIERLKKQGIREYLTKPLNVRQFLDAVAKALNQEKR